MTRLNITLLSLLLPAALAFPQYAYKPSGGVYPTGGLSATGGHTTPYGRHNSTIVGPTRTGSVSVLGSSVAVEPLPVHIATTESPMKSLPVGDSGINIHNKGSSHGGKGSSNPVSNDSGSCGPVTVTVTSRNTVTVTVKTLAKPKVAITVPHAHGKGPSTGVVSSSASAHKHGYYHTTLHHKSGSSTLKAHHESGNSTLRTHHKSGDSTLSNSVSVASSKKPLTPGTLTQVTTLEATSKSSSPVPESKKPGSSITSNPPKPGTTTPVAYKAPVHKAEVSSSHEEKESKKPRSSITSSSPKLGTTTPVAYKAPVHKAEVPSSHEEKPSIPPAIPHVYTTAKSPKEISSSSNSLKASSTPVAFKALAQSNSKAAYSIPSVTPEAYLAAPRPKEAPLSASLKASSSPVYHAPASTSAISQSVPSIHSTSSPGTKRGLVYNSAALTQSFSSSSAISWCYNWDSQPGGDVPSKFEFVPMMWGPIEVHTSNWNANADSAIAKGSTHLLGFNEPDLPEQANLTPQQAADSWHTYMEPYAGKAKLGSPAVCNGGGLTGLNWLNSFFDACSGCTIDFVPIHWYGLANDDGVADFKDHTAKAIAAAKGKPVWITEFKPDGSPEEMKSFMTQILPFLDSNADVERYSWFEVDGILASGNSLTSLGSQYAA